MPQQLIYTSAPRGVVAGRSGHCTVARSAGMREALALRLEQLSYYHHLALTGGQERPIHACRILDLRGARFHVLTRIQDAGLDFTGRTNFIAHHLVFTPEELPVLPFAPLLFRDWPGWKTAWTEDPRFLDNEHWESLLPAAAAGPARTWQQLTGSAVNAAGLLDANAAFYAADGVSGECLLSLVAESLELLHARRPPAAVCEDAWQHTFTTSLQEQDQPNDFRWRFVHRDNPVCARLLNSGQELQPITAIRAARVAPAEAALASQGRQPPRIQSEPQDLQIAERQPARFAVQATALPEPQYQWYQKSLTAPDEILPGQTTWFLSIAQPPFGVSRYFVRVSNCCGEVVSRVAQLSVEKAAAAGGPPSRPPGRHWPGGREVHVRSESEIAAQKKQLAETARRKGRGRWLLLLLLAIGLAAAAGVAFVALLRPGPNAAAPAPSTRPAPEWAPAPVAPVPAIPVPVTNRPAALLVRTNAALTNVFLRSTVPSNSGFHAVKPPRAGPPPRTP